MKEDGRMHADLTISFPRMGDYHIPVERLLRTLFPGQRVLVAKGMTRNTIEQGARHSPDYVCAPFKYNMGNYLEALEAGANVLLQTGTGCRAGYYGEVQEQILRDLGYKFHFVCLARENAHIMRMFNMLRDMGSPLSFRQFAHALLLAVRSVQIMDAFAYGMRENMAFEAEPGMLEALYGHLLEDLREASTFKKLHAIRRKYVSACKRAEKIIPEHPLRVGIVGELYTLMEPYSNFYIERELAKYHISVSRKMSVSFLLFGSLGGSVLHKAGGYLKYTLGATAAQSVAQCRQYAKLGYDGVIHMKSSGCTPELNAIPALMNIARDYKMPVLQLSFDTQTNEAGFQTRLEAFVDMIIMRREHAHEGNSAYWRGYRVDIHKRGSH